MISLQLQMQQRITVTIQGLKAKHDLNRTPDQGTSPPVGAANPLNSMTGSLMLF